jgi:hypothetical protein
MRFSLERSVRDGRLQAQHARQCVLTGFGKTKRIVFFDTLISRLSENEIEAVLAHELGHFKLHHVVRRMAWTFAVSLLFLWLLGQLKDAAWFYHGLGVDYPATNAMALLLFVLVVPLFTFLLQPFVAMYSRKHEFEADEYAARYSSAGELVSALVKLTRTTRSTLTPDPLHSAFYDSHPPASIRIAKLQSLAGALIPKDHDERAWQIPECFSARLSWSRPDALRATSNRVWLGAGVPSGAKAVPATEFDSRTLLLQLRADAYSACMEQHGYVLDEEEFDRRLLHQEQVKNSDPMGGDPAFILARYRQELRMNPELWRVSSR